MKKENIFKIIAIILLAVVAVVCAALAFPDREEKEEETTEEKTTLPDGFYRNGEDWCFYENGEESSKTDKIEGTVDGKSGLWMTVDGKVDFSLTSLEKAENDTWQYVKNGEVTEESDSSVSLIFGEMLDSISGEKIISTFGNFELSEENKNLLQSEIDKNTSKGYKTGFVVMNLNSLEGFSYNADEKIYSASTIKGPYIVSMVKSDNSLLEKEKTRIEATLIRSSNYDYESLRDKYGNEHFISFSAETGNDLVVDTTRNYQFLTPRKLAHLWLGNYIFFESGETGDSLGKIFENPVISPIHEIFSEEFITRTKAGWITKNNTRVTNDAGIVYTENGDFLVVIMTTAPCDFSVVENMAEAIKSIIS